MSEDNPDKFHDAKRSLISCRLELLNLAAAFNTTGNIKVSDRLYGIVEAMESASSEMSEAYSDLMSSSAGFVRQMTGSILSAALNGKIGATQ